MQKIARMEYYPNSQHLRPSRIHQFDKRLGWLVARLNERHCVEAATSPCKPHHGQTSRDPNVQSFEATWKGRSKPQIMKFWWSKSDRKVWSFWIGKNIGFWILEGWPLKKQSIIYLEEQHVCLSFPLNFSAFDKKNRNRFCRIFVSQKALALTYFPQKLTCPLKINGWFRCISYWNRPFLGGQTRSLAGVQLLGFQFQAVTACSELRKPLKLILHK